MATPQQHSLSPEDWLSQVEGKLSVDVLENDNAITVRTAIAGVNAEDLDISLSDDTLTIRGERSHGSDEGLGDLHVQECYWGAFSRTILLPAHVDPDTVDASLKRGILTVKIKKVDVECKVNVREEN